jgi:hypothetical protein
VESRKDFSNGPVWDPERERYFVELLELPFISVTFFPFPQFLPL